MQGKFLILSVFIILFSQVSAQENLSNIRTRELLIQSDTLFLDTLSIVPQSLSIQNAYLNLIKDSLLSIDYAKAQIIIKDKARLYGKKLRFKYRVFPYNFSEKYTLRENPLILSDEVKQSNKIRIQTQSVKKENFFKDELKKNGSISRGFMVGNQRDLSTVSNLNLQLSGKINDEVSILAAISDNNLPIQPEGNTQQIQEFDNVFVQLFTKESGIILGDFLLQKPQGYFMHLDKKSRGTKLYSTFKLPGAYRLQSGFSAGLAKGKYNRIKFTGIDGNQGPYRLTGTENEQFIIILSGTEKVYIDGELMKRGQNFDYTIDYNTAEITFTQNRLITKDKRITVEFEYALQLYPRTVIFQTNKLSNGKNSFWLNFYRHSDNKNDPLSLLYSKDAQKSMSEIGDSIQNAFYPNVDSIGYTSDYVMYELIDTLANGIVYDSIYRQSNDSQKAVYRLGFSFVGVNKGNYRQVSSLANGKVYEWVAPVNNIPQGEYEPIVLLITPKTQLLSTAGANFAIGDFGNIFIETAFSNFDLNKYSLQDKDDDAAFAGRFIFNRHLLKNDTSFVQLKLRLKYQFADKNFKPLDNYRSVEFERDWNVSQTTNKYQEQRGGVEISFFRKNLGTANSGIEILNGANSYLGKKAFFNSNLQSKGFEIDANINFLKTKDVLNKTSYIRHKVLMAKHFKLFTFGASEYIENNLWQNNSTDSLILNSFSFSEYEFFIKQADSVRHRFFTSYKIRENKLPLNNSLQTSDKSEILSAGLSFRVQKGIRLSGRLNYRTINYRDTLNNELNNENSLTGRGELQMRLAKGSFVWSSFYETGFGFESIKNYQYIEVPAGQGQFTWIDYNGNNIKELNEFEYAKYQDEANYIRIVLQSPEKQKIFSSQLNQTIVLMPMRIWMKSGGIKKFISRFSNRFALRILQKSDHEDYIPDLSNNPNIISLSFDLRNIFTFKTFRQKWQVDYIFNQNKQKIPLSSGTEFKNLALNRLKLRYKLNKQFTLYNDFAVSSLQNTSDFFEDKTFLIKSIENRPALQFQNKINWFINLSWQYVDKQNIYGTERALVHEIKLIYNQNILLSGNLQANFSLININYNNDALNPIAYEMLEGLLPGKNMLWELVFNKKLSKVFQLQINYTGRLNENAPVIHNGGIQLRASF
ncbi:MAG: hypothetical protein L3J74_04490 [Bacteroidales bacterium]|nr:hypothetical protein [Bacteroidales bacterium]